MTLYFDSSALVKMVHREAESAALKRFIRRNRSEVRASSALARTELIRAVASSGPTAVADARLLLSGLDQLAMTDEILDAAGDLPLVPPLRLLDAVHVASARSLGTQLRALVTYDPRMRVAAEAIGLPVIAPV